jgi:signal recognition particle GTPase
MSSHVALWKFFTWIQAAMEGALLRILTPKCSVDILHDIHQAKEQGRPYVIVFVGVNGVGKSTNLAKVKYDFQTCISQFGEQSLLLHAHNCS